MATSRSVSRAPKGVDQPPLTERQTHDRLAVESFFNDLMSQGARPEQAPISAISALRLALRRWRPGEGFTPKIKGGNHGA